MSADTPSSSGSRAALAGLVLATALSYPLGLAVGQAWLLPLLNTLPAYVLMARSLRRGQRSEAVTVTLVWAAALAVCGTLSFALWRPDPAALVLNGADYRAEMFHWIRTGQGSEGDWRLFLPQHLAHLGAFVAASLASASVVSMCMGAVLMNYMACYVAGLARAGVPPATVLAFGWQPWALCRVAAFCVLGAALAEPLLSRLWRYDYRGLRAVRPYLLWASAGIFADWLLKAALAPTWGRILRGALERLPG